METWKKIEGFEDWYSISSYGRLKTTNWRNARKTRIIKTCGEYPQTMIKSKCGKYRTVKIHRLVANTFIPNPENKPQINHINGIKNDNRVDNLEWCTNSENIQHAYANGLMKITQETIDKCNATKDKNNSHARGEKNAFSMLTDEKVLEIRAKFKPRVYTRKMLAKEYGVKEATIKDVVLRKSWRHIK